jgi:uncharacterized phage infection (PIP) family protein YhgE
MSKEEDIFLKTFNEMIGQLKELNSEIKAIKESVAVILPSIDGLGTGLTNLKNQLNLLSSNLNTSLSEPINHLGEQLSSDLDEIKDILLKTQTFEKTTSAPKQPVKKPKAEPEPKKQIATKTTPASDVRPQASISSGPQHPIFIDLINKINEATKFKEVGELLVSSLDQIESSFSFSRVFYEIRRTGNSLIRKGQADFPPNERLELTENILEWEKRLKE